MDTSEKRINLSLGMSKNILGVLYGLVLLPFFWGAAHAQQAAPAVKAELTQMLVTTDNGKETLQPAKTIKPGDIIEYRVVYSNTSDKAVSDVQANLPLPEGLQYLPKSARPTQNVEAALATGGYGKEPLMRDGPAGQKEPIPYDQYRKLRWTLGQIAPGAKTEVSARLKVPSVVTAAPANSQPAAPVAGR